MNPPFSTIYETLSSFALSLVTGSSCSPTLLMMKFYTENLRHAGGGFANLSIGLRRNMSGFFHGVLP